MRVRLHYLLKYAPETNPIERVRWHLHETITRNHRCHTIDVLLRQIFQWLNPNHFLCQTYFHNVYQLAA
jgi:hypothetical protein